MESGKTVMLFGDPGLLVLITPVVMPGLTVAPQPPPRPISVEAVKIELATRLYQVHPTVLAESGLDLGSPLLSTSSRGYTTDTTSTALSARQHESLVQQLSKRDDVKLVSESRGLTFSGISLRTEIARRVEIPSTSITPDTNPEYRDVVVSIDFVPIALGNGKIRLEARLRTSPLSVAEQASDSDDLSGLGELFAGETLVIYEQGNDVLLLVTPRRVIHDSPEKAQLYVHPLQADPEASDLQSEVALPGPARKPSKRSKRTGNSQTTKEALRELRNDVSALRGDVRQLINILEQQKSEAEKRQLPPARKPSAIDQSGDVPALDGWPNTHPTEANPPDDTVEPYTIHINPAVIGQLRQGSAVYEKISEEDEGIRQIRVVLDSGDARNSEFAEIPDVIGAVDQGWRPREDGGLDFYVQLRDEQFEAFVDGAKIDFTVDSNVAAIRHIYVFVGDNRLPRQLPE